MSTEKPIFENGALTCCPICENEDPEPYKLNREFGSMVYHCDVCNHYSTWDLTHGIEVGENKSNKGRSQKYGRIVRSKNSPYKSVLEIGPGNYHLVNWLVIHPHHNAKIEDVTTIDVGMSFRDKLWQDPEELKIANKHIKALSVPNPTNADEIFDVSYRMREVLEAENRRWDIGFSLHSLEHSPDPMTMIDILEELCDDFVIEVPDGTKPSGRGERADGSITQRGVGMFVKLKDEGPFPVKMTKKEIVGGHYQLFTADSLIYIAENHLGKHETYYVGRSLHFHKNTVVLTTVEKFINGAPIKIIKKKK